jgi:heat-inducible transcriptional repressor
VLAGERKLLGISDFSSNISQLRRAYELFEHKAELMQLLESSEHGQGVRIFIGGESQTLPVQELSIVSAPYAVNGDIVGTLGVIGPTRMRYERMVQIVDISAKLVGNALSYPQA